MLHEELIVNLGRVFYEGNALAIIAPFKFFQVPCKLVDSTIIEENPGFLRASCDCGNSHSMESS